MMLMVNLAIEQEPPIAKMARTHLNGIKTVDSERLETPQTASVTMPTNGTTTESKSSFLLHRSLNVTPVEVVSAKGIYLTLSDGRKIIDACTGAAVACVGHGHPAVAKAVAEQMSALSYVHTLTYTTPAAEDLASLLLKDNPWGFSKAYFVCSGSEAMDSAMKLARQYFYETEGPSTKRSKFIARSQAYHGNTIGALNISSNLPRKKPYANFQLPEREFVSWLTPAYQYQYSDFAKKETENAYAARLIAECESRIQSMGPETIIAIVAETVGGATTACATAPKGYFAGIRRLCNKYGILMILDEVMCGMGRTGTIFAFEQEQHPEPGHESDMKLVVPDLMTTGKGLGGGYAPVAGVLIHERVVQGLADGTGAFNHGHTYQAHPTACAASLAVQKIIRNENLLPNCMSMGQLLHSRLQEAFQHSKHVGEIRGRGLFWGIEFVVDKTTRASFPPELGFAAKFQATAFEMGVAVYPGSTTVDGVRGDHAILAPPYNVTESEVQTIVNTLRAAYDAVVMELGL